jgi:pyruvate dehydrogenase E1 component alpha subunit
VLIRAEGGPGDVRHGADRWFCHLYIGQEAVVVGAAGGVATGRHDRDLYRDHGHMLACGWTEGVMSELTGRRCGYSRQ